MVRPHLEYSTTIWGPFNKTGQKVEEPFNKTRQAGGAGTTACDEAGEIHQTSDIPGKATSSQITITSLPAPSGGHGNCLSGSPWWHGCGPGAFPYDASTTLIRLEGTNGSSASQGQQLSAEETLSVCR